MVNALLDGSNLKILTEGGVLVVDTVDPTGQQC